VPSEIVEESVSLAAPADGPSAAREPSPAFVSVIDAQRGSPLARLAEALRWHELLLMLVGRDIKVRYRQAAFGVVWALVVPAAMLAVYWVVFSRFGRLGPDGLPYVLFLFPAMLAFNYFTSSVGRAANSLKHDAPILAKVYFPRLLLPISNVISPLMDVAIGLVIMVVILLVLRHVPPWTIVFAPAFLAMGMAAACGMGMGLSALNAHFRDVQHMLPVLLQIWFFASPVLYSTDLVPEHLRLLYAVNPMVTVCEGVRACLIGHDSPLTVGMAAVSVASSAAMMVVGLTVFMRLEQTVTDVL
jgi:lipopolysaccharide transport system permease protein